MQKKLMTMLKKILLLSAALFFIALHQINAQSLIVKNATTTSMVLTDFVFIDPSCTVPMPNYYCVNFPLPPTSYSYPPVSHTGTGWKLLVSDGTNSNDVRDETPIGCGSGFINSAPIGSYTMLWWYEPNGDIFLYIF